MCFVFFSCYYTCVQPYNPQTHRVSVCGHKRIYWSFLLVKFSVEYMSVRSCLTVDERAHVYALVHASSHRLRMKLLIHVFPDETGATAMLWCYPRKTIWMYHPVTHEVWCVLLAWSTPHATLCRGKALWGCVLWPIYMCAMNYSFVCVKQDPSSAVCKVSIRVLWPIYMCAMNHSYVCERRSFELCASRLHMCAISNFCVCLEPFIYICHDKFICVP